MKIADWDAVTLCRMEVRVSRLVPTVHLLAQVVPTEWRFVFRRLGRWSPSSVPNIGCKVVDVKLEDTLKMCILFFSFEERQRLLPIDPLKKVSAVTLKTKGQLFSGAEHTFLPQTLQNKAQYH